MVDCERFVNSRFTSNTYIISCADSENIWIVDPGDTKVVFEWMYNHSKTIVSGILLTHGHFDHIYGVNDILSRFPACVVYVANAYGREVLSDPKKNASKYTEEGPLAVLASAHVSLYAEGMKLWDDTPMKVLYTPGHSDDSVCLIVNDMLFTGDTLIKDVRTVTKLKTGSREKLMETIALLETFKGQGLTVYPGHGEVFRFDDYDLDQSVGTIIIAPHRRERQSRSGGSSPAGL